MTHAVPQKAAALIARDTLLPEGACVCAALSGGADSTALLLALRELGYRVSAFHLNHCLRGAESDRDEAFVRALCARLGVPLTVRRVAVACRAAESGLGIEEAARQIRYRLLAQAARENGCGFAATAHTADDNLETMLFHLARGTGGKGLSGIPPVRGNIVRPLLACTRAEIEGYLGALGEPFVTDSSNLSDDYTRNLIRHEVVPVLRRINPEAAAAASRLAGLLRQDEVFLESAVQAQLAQAADGGGWRVGAFLPALRGRMLHRLLEQNGAPMSAIGWRHIRLLEGLLASGNPSAVLSLPGGLEARREYGRFFLRWEPRVPETPPETALRVPFSFPFRDGVRVHGEICKKNLVIHKKFNTFLIDCGTIDFDSLAVRTRRPGDRLRLNETGGSKTLKRLMIDHKIPREKRDLLAVFTDRYGVIAVEGLGSDCRRQAGGEMILQLSVEE